MIPKKSFFSLLYFYQGMKTPCMFFILQSNEENSNFLVYISHCWNILYVDGLPFRGGNKHSIDREEEPDSDWLRLELFRKK